MSGLPAVARVRRKRGVMSGLGGGPLVYAGRGGVMSGLPAVARSCTPEEEAS